MYCFLRLFLNWKMISKSKCRRIHFAASAIHSIESIFPSQARVMTFLRDGLMPRRFPSIQIMPIFVQHHVPPRWQNPQQWNFATAWIPRGWKFAKSPGLLLHSFEIELRASWHEFLRSKFNPPGQERIYVFFEGFERSQEVNEIGLPCFLRLTSWIHEKIICSLSCLLARG